MRQGRCQSGPTVPSDRPHDENGTAKAGIAALCHDAPYAGKARQFAQTTALLSHVKKTDTDNDLYSKS
jgi:hypothetical protein